MKAILLSLALALLMVGCEDGIVDQHDLEDRGGIMYLEGERLPFTGFVKGREKIRSPSFPSTELAFEGNYQNGKKEGIWVVWYDNGQKAYETNYNDGKREGVHAEYNKDGSLASESEYKDGELVESSRPNFSSVEFDADDTSYSPAETHSMNELSKELVALKGKLLERDSELKAEKSEIAKNLEALEKKKKELGQIREDLSTRLADFESKQGQDISETKKAEYKDTAKRWVEMGPEVASVEIQNWRQKRRFEEALTIFEMLKAEEKAPILAFMLNSDEDALIELADALAMRDRGLLPSLDLDEVVTPPKSSEPVGSAKAIDLDDPATLEEILAEAINIDEYIHVGNEVLKNGSPITGWVKNTDEHGVRYLGLYKNGKHDGPWIRWYKSGNKDDQGCYKDGKRNGLWLDLKKDGTVRTRKVYKNDKLISKDGERVEEKSNEVTPFVAPHGGRLIEMGKHGLGIHLELLLHDQGFLQIFVLDAHAENLVRIAQPTIEFLGTDSTGAKKTFHCDAIADPVTGSTVGDTALFTSREKFSGELPLKGNISSLKVLGKTYEMIAFEFPGNSVSLQVSKGSTYYLFASEIELYPTNLQNDLWEDRKNGPVIRYKILWQGNQVFESELKKGALIADWTGLALDLEWTDLMGKSISPDEAIKAARIRYEKGGIVKIVVGQDDLTDDDDHGQLTVSLDALKIGENVIQLKKTSTNAMHRINLRVLPYGSSLKDLIELMR